jgi:hypothetical protein
VQNLIGEPPYRNRVKPDPTILKRWAFTGCSGIRLPYAKTDSSNVMSPVVVLTANSTLT